MMAAASLPGENEGAEESAATGASGAVFVTCGTEWVVCAAPRKVSAGFSVQTACKI